MKKLVLVFACMAAFVCCIACPGKGFCNEPSRVKLFGSEQLGRYMEMFNSCMESFKEYRMTEYSSEVKNGRAFVTVKLGNRNDEKVIFDVNGTNVVSVETVIYPASELYLKTKSWFLLICQLFILGAIDDTSDNAVQNYVTTAERELSFATEEQKSMEIVKKVDNYTTNYYRIEKTYESATGAMHFKISKFVEKKERDSGITWYDQPQANPYNPYGYGSAAPRDRERIANPNR